jgi:alkylation response protein AidB-like acyl-CoA dehydrogenase
VHFRLAELKTEVEALRALTYRAGGPVARAYRDRRLTSIGGDADEIMLTIIAKVMGMLPRT